MTGAQDRLKKLVKLGQAADVSPFEIGDVLAEMEASDDDVDLDDLAKKTGRSRRTLIYLRNLAIRVMWGGIEMETLAGVGWTKVSILAEHGVSKNIEADLALAKSLTTDELARHLSGRAKPGEKKRKALLFRLTVEQHKVLTTVLPKFGASISKNGKGLVNKEKALVKALTAASKYQSLGLGQHKKRTKIVTS